ncbi:hypothetical protein YC2023_075269 [Brassica napus]
MGFASHKYNAYRLLSLAKHYESSSICEEPLVSPIDCEWVWHCHRLDPVNVSIVYLCIQLTYEKAHCSKIKAHGSRVVNSGRYKSDCEEFYGRVLDNSGIVSSANGSCKLQTEKLWKRLYPMEPCDLDLDKAISEPISPLEKCTTYDLVSAAKRQSSFYLEVSKPFVGVSMLQVSRANMKFSQLTGMKKEIVQNLEWLEAQKIEISIDLIAESKKHLQFLGVVDCNQLLYDGPALKRAIYRYNAYWLPLLAKHSESSSICEGPLVPPFDCEWVWHCHRLNPVNLSIVRYKSDCEEFYGRVLDNSGILSSANGSCKLQTEKLWKRLYPMESYDLDLDKAISEPISPLEKCTTYDLVSAAKRQSSFYLEVSKPLVGVSMLQVSRANVDSVIIMEEVVGRYKAFLYLIKQNGEKTIKPICVPTYTIDLIWHTHQLNPSSYYKDMVKIFGNILQHDDTADSDTSEGMNLDTVYSRTTAQCEETFGQRYWKASKDTMPHTLVVVEIEKSGAGARCFAEAAEKCCAGARCFAVEAEKNSARCFTVEAEKKNARCFAVVAEENSARCFALEVEKKNAIAMEAEKKNAIAMEAEKKNARFFAVEVKKDSDRCFSGEAEKENASARCSAMATRKNSARCSAMATRKNSARCFAVAAEKNGGLGSVNLMENNAKENAPLAEGATAA